MGLIIPTIARLKLSLAGLILRLRDQSAFIHGVERKQFTGY